MGKSVFFAGEVEELISTTRKCVINAPITTESILNIIKLSGKLASKGFDVEQILKDKDLMVFPKIEQMHGNCCPYCEEFTVFYNKDSWYFMRYGIKYCPECGTKLDFIPKEGKNEY